MSSWTGTETLREQTFLCNGRVGRPYKLGVRHEVWMQVLQWVVVVAGVDRVFAQDGEHGGLVAGGRVAHTREA